ALSTFVSHLLSGQMAEARSILTACSGFRVVMTRDFGTVRVWLERRQRGSRRIGLIASSGGRRPPAHGLDVRAELDVENWFLNGTLDVRSSYYLETPDRVWHPRIGTGLDWSVLGH